MPASTRKMRRESPRRSTPVTPSLAIPRFPTPAHGRRGERELFEAAITKDANIAVITPGAEKPLFLSNPVLGLMGQFKGFSAAAQERILISNLQEADGRTLQGFCT